MHKDMSLAEIWEKTSAVRDEGILVYLTVRSNEKPTGLTASNTCVASCDPLKDGEWCVGLWRSQLNNQARKDPEVAGLIVNGLEAARQQHRLQSPPVPGQEL